MTHKNFLQALLLLLSVSIIVHDAPLQAAAKRKSRGGARKRTSRGGGGARKSGKKGGGGGGGGGSFTSSRTSGGSGGSGVVILRYPAYYSITIGAGLTGTESAASGGYKRATITAGTGNVSWA